MVKMVASAYLTAVLANPTIAVHASQIRSVAVLAVQDKNAHADQIQIAHGNNSATTALVAHLIYLNQILKENVAVDPKIALAFVSQVQSNLEKIVGRFNKKGSLHINTNADFLFYYVYFVTLSK